MELILKEDVVNLGYKNDIVTVKSGYGRNYLIPTGKAVIASPAAKKMLAEELKQRAHKLEKIKKDAEAVAETLKGVSLGSDAFFPFGDNIERAHKSGVDYIAQAGGSVRDDHVIETCDKYGIAMSFTGIRLFYH